MVSYVLMLTQSGYFRGLHGQVWLRREHDLDTGIFFIAEHVVGLWSLAQRNTMSYEE